MPKRKSCKRTLPIKDSDGNLICCSCGVYKSPSEFYNNSSKSHYVRDGKESTCIECKKDYDRERKLRSLTVEEYLIILTTHTKFRTTNKREFNLTSKDVIEMYYNQDGKCALTGKEMTFKRGEGKLYLNISLDRKDASIGYTKENTQLVCYIVNIMKNTLTIKELLEWCKSLLEHNKK